TQCHAFRQPMARPMISSSSVQEWLPGWCLSSQMPSATPASVGTTTDQPISPVMPKPNQTPCLELRALSLRAAFSPISLLNAVGSFSLLTSGVLLMMKLRQTAYEIALHFRHHRADALLPFVQVQKLPFHRLMEFAKIR